MLAPVTARSQSEAAKFLQNEINVSVRRAKLSGVRLLLQVLTDASQRREAADASAAASTRFSVVYRGKTARPNK